jgi:hypothetical protein
MHPQRRPLLQQLLLVQPRRRLYFVSSYHKSVQARLAVVHHFRVSSEQVEHFAVVAHRECPPFNLEFIQIRIAPSEGRLENVMQLAQRDISVDPDLPPDGRLDVSDLRVKRVEGVGPS